MSKSNDEYDELSGIFDHLTPEDFMVGGMDIGPSVVDEVHRADMSAEAFRAFVEEQLRAVRIAYAAAGGQINPVAIVASGRAQRMLTPTDEETLGDWVERVRRDAREIDAIWTFVSKRTEVAHRLVDADDVRDVSDPGEVEKARAEGIAEVGIFWYAERRDGDTRHHRQGILLGNDSRITTAIEGSETQAVPLFAQILG